ncbi:MULTISPECIES: RloB family protein [Spirulina sp. CCY15215]|uniref:RloB family protein n=1 Tax=Spirulina sp. CCY15215 TaxID=2767591 RepID=UPI00195281D7|nr:RloB family protein [Spirulina major]
MSKKNRDFKQRKVNRRQIRKRFLIICEGEQTEPNYFKYFQQIGRDKQKATIDIEIQTACNKGGGVGITVVKEAIKKKKKDRTYEKDEVWCVFDRDAKPENKNQHNFNEAIQLASNNDINLAISNDAFELWYLLHYEYYESATHRSNLNEMLSTKTRLGEKYKKNSQDMYDKLKDKQENAIRNAKKLWQSYARDEKSDSLDNLSVEEKIRRHNMNPSTTVFQLVETLNRVIFEDSD